MRPGTAATRRSSTVQIARATPTKEVVIALRCEEFGEVLSEYIEGELNQEEAKRVEVHLLRCPACSCTFRGVQQVRVALRSLGRRNPPARIEFAVPTRLQGEASSWSRYFRSRPMAVGLAVVVGIGVVLWPAPQEVGREYAVQDWGRGLDQAWYGGLPGEQVDPEGQGLLPPKAPTFPGSAQVRPVSF